MLVIFFNYQSLEPIRQVLIHSWLGHVNVILEPHHQRVNTAKNCHCSDSPCSQLAQQPKFTLIELSEAQHALVLVAGKGEGVMFFWG